MYQLCRSKIKKMKSQTSCNSLYWTTQSITKAKLTFILSLTHLCNAR